MPIRTKIDYEEPSMSIVQSMSGTATAPVIAGLAAGIGFIVLFSILSLSLSSFHANLEPKISQVQAINISKDEIVKNRWFFNFPENTPVAVLDFKDTNYYPEPRFLQEDHHLPLAIMYSNGTVTDLNGELSDFLPTCRKEIGYGHCQFVLSLHNSTRTLSQKGTLAYFVQLAWPSHTELFVVAAVNGQMINSTLYTRPVLHLADVERELQILGKPRITQQQALSIVEDDLRVHQVNIDDNSLRIQYSRISPYAPVADFQSGNLTLPLVYIHPSGNVIFLNETAGPTMGFYCTMSHTAYCSFLPPLNFDLKGRLVYGIDMMWRYGTGFYTIDAISGEIVDSWYSRP